MAKFISITDKKVKDNLYPNPIVIDFNRDKTIVNALIYLFLMILNTNFHQIYESIEIKIRLKRIKLKGRF